MFTWSITVWDFPQKMSCVVSGLSNFVVPVVVADTTVFTGDDARDSPEFWFQFKTQKVMFIYFDEFPKPGNLALICCELS